ncbi:MAG TPA: DUF4215 domain-containing protein [Candidatus Limnocylindrales bacterium]|nr:DUF4215 domain-containing protein [Candidatus Limnocylindrales bacterium]
MEFVARTGRERTRRTLIAVCSLAFLAASAAAHEGDHWPITGGILKMSFSPDGSRTRMLFKTKNQISINPVSLAKDPTLEPATLIVRGSGAIPGNTELLELDAGNWSRIGTEQSPKGWKYHDKYPSNGVTKVQLKTGKTDGSLVIQAQGHTWPFQIRGPQDSIEIVLTIGEFAFCAEYSADRMADFRVNREGEIAATFSLAPSDCPAVCGNGVVETGEECDDGNLLDDDTCTSQCLGCNPSEAEFASTYEGIQQLIFDSPVYNCSNDICHGAAQEAGLDLRAGSSYASLLGVASTASPSVERVFAGDEDKSMLYMKLADKTLGTTTAPGSPMPIGSAVLTEDHLQAVRQWIRGGAPADGVVAGTAELLGSCLPAPTPLDIPQPAAPEPSLGTQLPMPGYDLAARTEVEGCVASYYDVSATVPAEMIVDCPRDPSDPSRYMFEGTNGTGPLANKCFSYDGSTLYQDAQSHHSIVHIYPGDHDWDDEGWGGWRCYGGPTPQAQCSPAVDGACGEGGVCGSAFHRGVACLAVLGRRWGAPDFSTFSAPQFSGAQESVSDFDLPEGVFNTLPLKGLIVWNSHAFNLTAQPTEMEAWLNVSYTDHRVWEAQRLFNSRWIFAQNVPAFQQREYCGTHTFEEGARLFQLSSHTHKRGIRWRYYQAPQTPCSSPAACPPGDPGDIFYESYDYSDPLVLNPDPPVLYSGSVESRTIKFCSLYDNGYTDPADVKMQSRSPYPTGTTLVGGPCSDSAVRCMGGPNFNQLCHGNDYECPQSTCDACPLLGGVTTEDEMFIAVGSYYIAP